MKYRHNHQRVEMNEGDGHECHSTYVDPTSSPFSPNRGEERIQKSF